MLKSKFDTYFPFLIGLFSGIYFISLTVTGVSFTFYPGDLIDARFCNYLLEHAHLYFTGQVHSYWNAPFLFPEANVISYSENMLGSAPFYSLFRILGCDRESAFQLWYLFLVVLNYTASYLFLIKMFKNPYSAALGAMVFAFSMALQSQMGHAQTMARYPIPLAFLMSYYYLKELKPIYFFALLFFMVYQLYCGIYIGFMLVVPISFVLIFSLYYKWDHYKLQFVSLKWWFWIFISVLINILILAVLMIPYLARAEATGFYTYEHVSQTLLTPLSYFFSWHGSALWDFLSAIGTHYQWYTNFQVFAGGLATLCLLTVILLAIFKLLRIKINNGIETKQIDTFFFFVGVFTFLSFLRFGDFSIYRFLFYLPGFASMRALQRIINIELIFYAMAVAYIFAFVFQKLGSKRVVIFLFFVSFITLDNYVKFDFIHHHEKVESHERVNQLIQKMKDLPKQSLISYEPDSVDSSINDFHLDAMLAAQSLNLISLNGYTSTSPHGYSPYWSVPNETNRLHWLENKGMLNRHVTVIK